MLSLIRTKNPRDYAVVFFFAFTHLITVFARVIWALFFSILAAEKSGCVKYADFFCGGLDLGFILA